MRASILLAVLAVSCLVGFVAAEQFAVLVAGSNGYDNYRHQADVCHAYQILIQRGVKASNIITFFFDDIANNTENPYKWQLFNHPTAKGVPGKDVYTGCKGDYTGVLNNQDTFLAAISGNASGVPAGYPLLKSGPADHVFINFVDHGSPGAIYFMDKTGNFVPMYAASFLAALHTMHQKKMYSKLVIYLEACEAGSMFAAGMLPANVSIYAETASNPDESSWGTYCPGEKVGTLIADSVNGIELESCLGDLYSVNWMERVDAHGIHETLQQQYKAVQNATTLSHVMQYGDLSWTHVPVGDFIGNIGNNKFERLRTVNARDVDMTVAMNSVWNSRDISLKRAQHVYNKRVSEDRYSQASRDALVKLNAVVAGRKLADDVFNAFINNVNRLNQRVTAQSLFAAPALPIVHDECMTALDQTYMNMVGYTQYSIQYARVFINACRQHKNAAELLNALQATRAVATKTAAY